MRACVSISAPAQLSTQGYQHDLLEMAFRSVSSRLGKQGLDSGRDGGPEQRKWREGGGRKGKEERVRGRRARGQGEVSVQCHLLALASAINTTRVFRPIIDCMQVETSVRNRRTSRKFLAGGCRSRSGAGAAAAAYAAPALTRRALFPLSSTGAEQHRQRSQ